MTHSLQTPDFAYKWMNFDGRDHLKINDYILEFPDLLLPYNSRYIGHLIQGLYGCKKPCIISKLLQCMLLRKLEHTIQTTSTR